MKRDKKRRLSLLENGVSSTKQKLKNNELSDGDKSHLRGRLARFTKEIKQLKGELGLTDTEEKPNEGASTKGKPKEKATKKKRGVTNG